MQLWRRTELRVSGLRCVSANSASLYLSSPGCRNSFALFEWFYCMLLGEYWSVRAKSFFEFGGWMYFSSVIVD
jgi:hypothetical protein